MRDQNDINYEMPSPHSFDNLWRIIIGESKPNSVKIVAQRFLKAFNDHGIQSSQTPRLMPQIKLDDLQSEASILAALTPDLLDQTAKFFGISLKWLEGASVNIYEYQTCYKLPEVFFEMFAAIQGREKVEGIGIPFRVLTTNKKLDRLSQNYQPLVPVLVEKIAHL